MKIDAHQHFWKYNKESHGWINDEMAAIRKDFFPGDLLPELSSNGIEGTVLVQVDQTEEENTFMLGLAEHNDFIKGVVGWVDLRSDKIESRLEYYQSKEKFCGFRHIVQGEPDVNFMLGKAFQNGISLLEKYGFTYDILIFPTQLEAALKLVKTFPNQKFVIDHLAKPYIKKGEVEPWGKLMTEIAKYENVYCKVSGMVTEADFHNWKYENFIPYLDVVANSFGTSRIMFGSDWPVCLLGGSYSKVKGVTDNYFNAFSENEKKNIFGENAIRFYAL